MANSKISRLDRLYSDEGGIDVVGRSKTSYIIAVLFIAISILAIAVRGFNLSLDFEGGTKINMPAAGLVEEQIEETFVEATGVTPELVQVVGAGGSATLEITSERLSEDQITQARQAIYEDFAPKDESGEATPDAIGSSTVSESWGSTIINRMVLAMVVFFLVATAYVALRLQRTMAFAAMAALLFDLVVIAGIYALFGFEVSPAVIIGLLTVLTFSLYDTVIVFDKVNENTTGILGQRQRTYGEEANLAVNQTFMRSISTTVISALPIVALLVVAVWLLGIGTLRDLALIQFIGVIEGVLSSLFLATPLLVSMVGRRKDIQEHTASVESFRARQSAAPGEAGQAADAADAEAGDDPAPRRVISPAEPHTPAGHPGETAAGGASWRPGR